MWRFEPGGVGSFYCDKCRSKIDGQRDERAELVSRLRLGGPNAAEVASQAADEIERLRAEVKTLRDALESVHEVIAMKPGDSPF